MRKINLKWLWSGGVFALLAILLVTWTMLREAPVPEVQKTLIYDFSVKNPSGRVVHNADFWLSIPVKSDTIEIQKIDSSHRYRIETDAQNNQKAVISLSDIAPYSTESISLNIKLLLQQRPSRKRPGNMQTLLSASPLAESDDKSIADLAKTLHKSEPYQTASSTYEWVASNIKYVGFVKNDRGALYALKKKRGDCTEYAYLNTALARAVGIPARTVGGFMLGDGFKLDSSAYHNWSEIWVDGRWILVDSQNRVFDKEYGRYIVMNRLNGKRQSQHFFGIDTPLVARMN